MIDLTLGSTRIDIGALLKKLTSKVDGFTFVHFYMKVITSVVKVGYLLTRKVFIRGYYHLREVA